MKKLNLFKRSVFALIAVFGLALNSCSTDSNSSEDIEISEFEVQKVLAIDDYTGIIDNAITEAFISKENTGKRFLTQKDSDCYSTTYADSGFTMTFNNCTFNETDKVNGLLAVTYAINETSSTFTATYSDFYVGTIRLDGTRTFTISTTAEENEINFTVTSDMVITLEDGELITEAGTKTESIIFADDNIVVAVTGTWALVENGDTYMVTVTEKLTKLLDCEYFSDGLFTLSKNGIDVIVAMGDGTCDNKANIIYPNGTTEEVTL
ncbi:hypothetical protein [Cellulophaga sp. L1A9]|uniref:hypothetical protein n=1 Tax=Cellulophaga sp. L1A9 TaxID=2686362 RepID=UPI00131E5725|nr:hypothetical protein [Cellulophaga sp. L1A9]